jgi:cAMP-binding proteins - catabolite gene activator and regulatory subunit of cAMP-dependent protein kinases
MLPNMLPSPIQDFYSPWIYAQNSIWKSVLHLGEKHIYEKGNIILGGGKPVNYLYYLHAGRIKFSKLTADGDEKIVWYIDRENVFGTAPFFDRRPITNMCNLLTALEDCEVYTFSRECFNNEIIVRHPELLENLIQSMAYKIFLGVNRGGDLSSLPTRICKVLRYVIQRQPNLGFGEKTIRTKGISQQELADILGVHRVTLNNAISQLKREGIIGHMSKRSLVILDVGRLLNYVQE